jgi:phage-related protein
MMQL